MCLRNVELLGCETCLAYAQPISSFVDMRLVGMSDRIVTRGPTVADRTNPVFGNRANMSSWHDYC